MDIGVDRESIGEVQAAIETNKERMAQLKMPGDPVEDEEPAEEEGEPVCAEEAQEPEMNALMEENPIDVAFICIGENGHLAFNDPPADFDATDPYIVVDLERRSKRQQVSEGWFDTIDDVPEKAITMSVHEILSSRIIICACPDQRKAKAVASCIFDDISPASPCSSIRKRTECTIFLDKQSSRLVFGDMRTYD